MAYAIETANLTKEFVQANSLFSSFLCPCKRKKITLAVDSVNLQVKRGELFGLLGPNGAGKTTLIKILCCLILPARGTAKIAGYDILKEEEKVKASIGLVSGDERSFYWRLTGRQNLQFFASLYNLSRSYSKSRIEELLDLVGIKEPGKRFQEYSAGIKQRFAIAKSLLHNPEVLFMDEPTKSLDPGTAQKLLEFVKEKLVRQENKTIFFASHNLAEAEYFADRLAIMEKGKIASCGTPEELKGEISRCFFGK
jgi:ABC-2 type transport system ATP-binding protein